MYDLFEKDGFSYIIPDGTAHITDCKKEGVVEIPSDFDGVKVTGIYDYAFEFSSASKIVVPEGVTYLGTESFHHCRAEEIVLPHTIRSFGYHTFKDCYYLKKINLPDNIKFDAEEFADSDNLEQINVSPNSLYYYSIDGVLFGKSGENEHWLLMYPPGRKDEEYSIPEETVAIQKAAFLNNKYLKKVIFNGRTSTICFGAFAQCESLEEVVFSNDLFVIGESAFFKSGLKRFTLPNKLKKIEYMGFAGCLMTELHIPNGIEEIGRAAFRNCPMLEQVVLPPSIKSLGSSAFYQCASLKKAIIHGNSEGIISEDAFRDCQSLEVVEIEEGISSICKTAFCDCISLKSICLPTTLNKIEDEAFWMCKNLKVINYAGSEEDWYNIDFGNAMPIVSNINFNYRKQ